MSKTKIIVGIIIITALVIGGYFFLWPYYKDWQAERQNKKFLFSSISTQLPIESKQENASVGAQEQQSPPSRPSETEEQNKSIQPPQINIVQENPIETISSPHSPTESEIQEQILNPEPPSEITEKKFSPVAPQQSTPEPPVILTTTKNTEDKEEPEDEEESEKPVSTSTPAILPRVSIYLSGYSITARGFTVIWQSSSTDVSTYDIDRKISFGDWQNLIASTTATSTLFEVLQDNTVYFFRARAKNSAGLTSDWQEISAPINFYPIVINEIAWMGNSTSTASDEWIELFNKTNQPINLSGWNLKSITNSTPNSTTTGIIEANGFFLLERRDDTTIKDIVADQIYSGDLNNTGEILELRDNFGNLIDKVPLSDSGKWLAGKGNPDYQSMERVNPYLPVDVPGNWRSNNGLVRNGLNAFSQPINGTPKAQNSVFDLEFFYLYPAQNTTATSTILEWTPSYIDNFNQYKVIRSFDAGFNPASTTIVVSTTSTGFFDESLESETTYYYRISACDLSDYCVSSNTASTTTSEFPFLWGMPQLIFETATSSATSSEPLMLDIVFDAFFQPQIVWVSSSTAPNATSSDNKIYLTDIHGHQYIFWIEKSGGQSAIYFRYKKVDGWTSDKKIFDLPYEIDKFTVAIDTSNTVHLVFIIESNDPSSIPSQVYYATGEVE